MHALSARRAAPRRVVRAETGGHVATILLGGLLLREPFYARDLGALPVFFGCALVALASSWAVPPAAALVPMPGGSNSGSGAAAVERCEEGAAAVAAAEEEAAVPVPRRMRWWWQRARGGGGGGGAAAALRAPLLGAPAEEAGAAGGR
jgi:hypothetical protein